jgi:hypothetical protein
MDIPTSGPVVEKHNQMIVTPANYSYFMNNKTKGCRTVNTGMGTLLLAYSDQLLAQAVFDAVLGDSYSLLIVEGVTMFDFFDLVVGEPAPKPKGVAGFFKKPLASSLEGILLNLSLDFVAGRDDFIPNDQLLMHFFTREEFNHFRSGVA